MRTLRFWLTHPRDALCDWGLHGCTLHKVSGWYEPLYVTLRRRVWRWARRSPKPPIIAGLDTCRLCSWPLVIPLYEGDDRHIHGITDHEAVR